MNNLRQYASRWALTALMTLFGLQMIRVTFPTFTYYLRDAKGMDPLALAPIALGVFALSFLAGPLWHLAGLRTALIITAGGLALLRVAEQLSFTPGLDLILASAGVALFLMYIPIALGAVRAEGMAGTYHFCFALLLGTAFDTALHGAAGTLDLSWQQEVIPAFIVILLAAAALVALRRQAGVVDPATPADRVWSRILALAALGLWFFLQLVLFQNVARMGAITGWSLPVNALVVVLGNVLALLAAAQVSGGRRLSPLSAAAIGLLLTGTLLFTSVEGPAGALLFLSGQVLAALLLMIIFVGLGKAATQSGVIGASVANGIGSLLLVIFSFAFYASVDIDFGFRGPAILPVASILVALAAIRAAPGQIAADEIKRDYAPAIAGAILLLLPLGLLLSWRSPQPVAPSPEGNTVRITDYNLHNGFNTDGRLDLEALARVIEDSNPDIVSLQEVSRGWVVNGSVDMLEWLSQRLDMPYVSGPTEGMQWGNAVLSRYPVSSAENTPLAPESLLIRRGYLTVEFDLGGKRLQLIDTHLHHVLEDSDIRQQQVPALLDGWNSAPLTVITGDFNATPESAEMQLMVEAGLQDVSGEIGPSPGFTFKSTYLFQRIDYFWLSPDLAPIEFDNPQTTASDHLPLVTTISLP